MSLVGATNVVATAALYNQNGLNEGLLQGAVGVLTPSFDRYGTPPRLPKAFLRMMLERSVCVSAPGIDETRAIRLRKCEEFVPNSPHLRALSWRHKRSCGVT